MVECRNENCVGGSAGFKAGVGTGHAREARVALIAFDEIKLGFSALQAESKLAAIGKQCELVKGAVEG